MASKIAKLSFPNNCNPEVRPEIHLKAHKISRTMRLCGKEILQKEFVSKKLNDFDARPLIFFPRK